MEDTNQPVSIEAKTDKRGSRMAEATGGANVSLTKALSDAQTVTDLFKLANSDEFKQAARSLSDNELKALRALYRDRLTSLQGKVKLETFDGQVLNIVDIGYWHSDTWDNDGITLHFRPETEPDKRYQALTSSSILVRFANGFDTPPTETEPCRVLIHLIPVKDRERAAKGQKQWTIKRLPQPSKPGDGFEGAPF